VHAFGVILYQLGVGKLEERPGTDLEEELQDADVPARLIEFIRRCFAQKAERRAATGRTCREALQTLLTQPQDGAARSNTLP